MHPHVPHPRALPAAVETRHDRLLGWLATHVLASKVMFDAALILPLLALPMSTAVKVTLGVVSGSWIQWWALPALQRSQVQADRKRDAKADADHQALTHIAHRVDAILAAVDHEKRPE
jgi:predicted MFS family arabinose efflux permease